MEIVFFILLSLAIFCFAMFFICKKNDGFLFDGKIILWNWGLFGQAGIFFSVLAIVAALDIIPDKLLQKKKQTDAFYFEQAQGQIDQERTDARIEAAKKLLRDQGDYLITLQDGMDFRINQSDIDCVKQILEILDESDITLPVFLFDEAAVLLKHMEYADKVADYAKVD